MNKEINSDILFFIIPFMELPDIIHCQLVSKSWDSVVRSPAIWRSISDVSDKKLKKKFDLFHPWLISKIRKYKPEKILIYDRENLWSPSDIFQIFEQINENLQKLRLFLELEEKDASFLIKQIVKSCPNLKTFKTHGKFLTDSNMSYFNDSKYLTNFGVYNDDPGFTGINLKLLPPLKKLFLRPHNIDFQALMPVVEKSKYEITQIFFDCEIFEQNELLQVLFRFNAENMESIMMNYCDKFDEEVLKCIVRFKQLKKFKFTKGNSIERVGFFSFFKKLNCDKLLSLNLSECSEINDDSVFILSDKAKNLKKLNLSWCTEITSLSIKEIFTKCIYLKKIHLTGIKHLNRTAFPYIDELLDFFKKDVFLQRKKEKKLDVKNLWEYFKEGWDQQKIDSYKFLKFLSVRSCDLVVDEVLVIMKILFPGLKLMNYYGEELSFE